jgi:hypothetical protein
MSVELKAQRYPRDRRALLDINDITGVDTIHKG